jgi:hypothetical protein
MSYINVPPIRPPTPVSYVARPPASAKPPQTQTEPKPSVSSNSTHGPAVILGGSLAKPADRSPRPNSDTPKSPHHVDRVI